MLWKKFSPLTNKGKSLAELQAITSFVADGASAVSDITVTGVGALDTIESVTMFAAGVPSDVTADASVTAADTIQLATVDSTGNKLVVRYWAK